MSNLLQGLNPSQEEAVKSFGNPLLILAGAGSGKTRVLTHKIAFALEQGICGPHEFLAVTFTNKAAGEMKHRIGQLTQYNNMREAWVSTFHSFGNRLLRSYIDRLGYSPDFTILDTTDQTSLVRSILKDLRYDNSTQNARKIARQISWIKSDLKSYENIEEQQISHMTRETFDIYQMKLRQNNSLDFSDLLLKTLELLRKSPEAREELQNQFQYIFVDEYQDTNLIQYEMIKLLSKDKTNVCAVGDEDQSIYSWRGANIFNILHFEQDFPNTKIIKLEQNYRSTSTIIDAASAVIANNRQRKGKTLFTENPKGSPITILENVSEYEEAENISKIINKELQKGDVSASEIAIFYRTNSQSRVLEEQLRSRDIPYRIVGGLKFYDRKEIKDITAYMRLVVNPKDNISFRRVINVPTRGIGKTTLDKIEAEAAKRNQSLIETAIDLCEGGELQARAKSKLQVFLDILTQARESALENNIYDFYQELLTFTKYIKSLEDEGTIEAQSRIQNLEEFGNAIVRYGEQFPNENNLVQFLQHLALVSDETSEEDQQNSVTLMTLHVAKGLEFPLVFIAGLEEGLFPHINSIDSGDPDDMELEEERRLFYVGMTRAKKSLYLSYAKQRKVWGQSQYQSPSRFLNEIPDQFVEHAVTHKKPKLMQQYGSSRGNVQDPFPDYENASQAKGSSYMEGKRVYHPHFGSGIVHKVEGTGNKEKVSVLFDDKTLKKFLSQYANLEYI